MELALSEFLQTTAVMVIAFVVITLAALFLKAESATCKKPEDGSAS
jgi:hypothetical protein